MSMIAEKMIAHVTRAIWPKDGSRSNHDFGMRFHEAIPPTIRTAKSIHVMILVILFWGFYKRTIERAHGRAGGVL